MADTLDPKLIDKRTLDRNLRKGLIDEKTYEKHIKGLPDLSDKSAVVEATMGDEDEFDDEIDEDEADETDEEPAQA
jgi:hypothetical protein